MASRLPPLVPLTMAERICGLAREAVALCDVADDSRRSDRVRSKAARRARELLDLCDRLERVERERYARH